MSISATLPDVVLREYHGRPTVFVGETPLAMTGYSNFGQERLQREMEFFLNTGTEVFQLEIARIPGDQGATRFWRGDVVDPDAWGDDLPQELWDMDRQTQHILEHRPDAYILVRFVTRPPASWKALHEDEYFLTDTGEMSDTPSLASDLFWDAAAAMSAAVVRFCESRPWASRIVAYGNFHHTEGCHMPVGDGWLYDHSAPMQRRWRAFLREKYGTDAALQAAHGDPSLTLDTVEVPFDKLRGPVPEVVQIPYWQAGADNAALRDYLELSTQLFHRHFRQMGEAMAGAAQRKMVFLHDALKQVMQGWNLKGFFGYPSFGETVSWNPFFIECMAGSGSIAAAALDGVPGYQGLLTPHDYQARGMGGVYEPEGIADSTVLRGMFMYAEEDSRFHASYGIGSARDLHEAAALTWRNWASAATRGYANYLCWGFEMEDWLYCDAFHAVKQRQIEVAKASLAWEHATVPGIAMILDDAAVLETNGAGSYLNEAVLWEWHTSLPRCGVPFRTYLFEDLALDNFPEHRVFYFPNLFKVDDARLKLLQEKVFRNGHVVVWGPGSGISDGSTISPAHAERLTGFTFAMQPANSARRVLLSGFDHPITRDLPGDTLYGGPLPFGPVLLPTSGEALGAAWVKGGMNHTGLAVQRYGQGAGLGKGDGDYDALFTVAVQMPAALWRGLARHAGAHVYSDAGDVLMADSSIVAIHGLKPGPREIRLPARATVHDVISGETIAVNADRFTVTLDRPDTRVFRIE
jgi:hypothetical protein